MNETIAGLIRLQEMDKALEQFRQRTGGLAPRRSEVAVRRAAVAAVLDQAKKNLVDAQISRKNKEAEIDAKDAAVRKHSAELNGVKSNDAYRALVSEIDRAKKEKMAIEDEVLVLMEKIEGLQKSAKAAEAEAARAKMELDGLEKAIDSDESDLKVSLEAKKAERDSFAATLPASARGRYDSIQRGRPGFVAVVEAKGMVCGGCRTGLTPSLVNEVMKGKEIITCESCSRILFVTTWPAPPAPPTDGAASPSTPSSH